MSSAFSILREAARSSRRQLTEVASDIAGGMMPVPPWPESEHLLAEAEEPSEGAAPRL